MATLYDLTEDYMRLLEFGNDPDIDEDVFRDTLEGLDGEIEDKAEGYAKVIKQLEADAKMYADEVKRLTAKKKTAETNAKRMKKALQDAMVATGKTKFKTKLFGFNVQKNPPSVKLSDNYMAVIPGEYLIAQEPKVDKAKILDDLKSGKEYSWATIEQGESLRIR